MMDNPLYNPTVSSDYIYHYGIKGMKWGIRRTAEQLGHKIKSKFSRKKSSSDESGSQTSSKKIQGSVSVKGTKQNPGTTRTSDGNSLEERKQKVLESRSAKELYSNADLFTTQELQQAYNRLVLEKNIKSLSPKEVSKGQQMLNKYVDSAENISKFLNSTNKVLSQVTRFKNLVEGKGDKKKNDKKNDKNNDKKNDKKDNSDNKKNSNDNTKNKNDNESSNSSEKDSEKNQNTSKSSDEAVEADSYEVPKQKKTSTSEKYKTARDFVNEVTDVYDSYVDPDDGRVQDGMDFTFEIGDRFFNGGVYGLLEEKKK